MIRLSILSTWIAVAESGTVGVTWTDCFAPSGTCANRALSVPAGTTVEFSWAGVNGVSNHNVILMPNEADYNSCAFTSATPECDTNETIGGPKTVEKPCPSPVSVVPGTGTPGGDVGKVFYYACGIGGAGASGHCGGGQKIAITICASTDGVKCDTASNETSAPAKPTVLTQAPAKSGGAITLSPQGKTTTSSPAKTGATQTPVKASTGSPNKATSSPKKPASSAPTSSPKKPDTIGPTRLGHTFGPTQAPAGTGTSSPVKTPPATIAPTKTGGTHSPVASALTSGLTSGFLGTSGGGALPPPKDEDGSEGGWIGILIFVFAFPVVTGVVLKKMGTGQQQPAVQGTTPITGAEPAPAY